MSETFIAFSGGVESTALALLFGHKATPIFADPGPEHRAMRERLDDVETKLRAIHGEQFQIIRIKAEKPDGKPVDNLLDYIRSAGVFPNQQMRFCTKYFKIFPFNRFLADKLPCSLMVGLNHEERDRDGNHGLEGVTIEYPLQDLELTRSACEAMLREYSLEPRLPVYMRRGGCFMCPFKTRKEYAAMVHLSLDEIEQVAALEQEINSGSKNKRARFWAATNAVPEGMRDFIDNEKRANLFSADEMYTQQPGAIQSSCGVFCHR